MADFNKVLGDINNGVAALSQALPTISATGIGSLQSISTIVAVSGAAVASSTTDQQKQAETIAATQTALALIPLLFSLFHRNAQPTPQP